MIRVRTWWVAATVVALAGSPLTAQEKKDDRLEKALFDPQLVLQKGREVGLSKKQRQQILEVVKKVQTELVPLQLDMAEPALELLELIEKDRVDESTAVAKAEQVLKIENEVKKRQMSLLIRIKNILTPEQQARLRAIRDGGASPRPGDGDNERQGEN